MRKITIVLISFLGYNFTTAQIKGDTTNNDIRLSTLPYYSYGKHRNHITRQPVPIEYSFSGRIE